MLQVRVMPCLLLQEGALIKTVKFNEHRYIGDPINAVRIFNECEVDELIFLDISASKAGQPPPFRVIEEIASECFMPLTYGGGVRHIEDIKHILSLGAEKVSLNAVALRRPHLITEAARAFGSQSIIASIDVKKDMFGRPRVWGRKLEKPPVSDPVEWAREVERLGAGEILLTSVDRDGTWKGYDLALLQRVARAVKIPVVACGGAGRIPDLKEAIAAGASAAAVGSMVVFQKQGLGVLINFPSHEVLDDALGRV